MAGLPAGRDVRRLPPVHLQVPRVAVRPRRRVHLRPAGVGVLRPRQGRTTGSYRCTATCGRAGSSSTSIAREPPTVEGVPGRLRRGHRGLPVPRDDPGRTSTGPKSPATGSSTSTPLPSSTTHPCCTRSSRCRRNRRNCRARATRPSTTRSTARTVSSRRGAGWHHQGRDDRQAHRAEGAERLVRSVGPAHRHRPSRRAQPVGEPGLGPRLVSLLSRT